MAPRPSKEEQKIITLIDKMPFNDKDKEAWIKTIMEYGFNEEMIKEVQGKISELPKGEDALNLARQGAQFNRLIQSWRLSTNLSGGRHKFS